MEAVVVAVADCMRMARHLDEIVSKFRHCCDSVRPKRTADVLSMLSIGAIGTYSVGIVNAVAVGAAVAVDAVFVWRPAPIHRCVRVAGRSSGLEAAESVARMPFAVSSRRDVRLVLEKHQIGDSAPLPRCCGE